LRYNRNSFIKQLALIVRETPKTREVKSKLMIKGVFGAALTLLAKMFKKG